MNLEGVLVEDQKKDTLIYTGKLQVNITDWFFIKEKADIKYVGIEDAKVLMNRSDSIWNYQFLNDYFSGGTASTEKKDQIVFDLKKVSLKNIAIIKKDMWRGEDMIVKDRKSVV